MAECETYTVTTSAPTVSGNNNTGLATNHVVQYPKPPRRDDGKWLSIGAMLGSILGMLTNRDKLEDADDAEDEWKAITDKFRDKGYWLLDTHAEKLVACVDSLHEKLCALANCGYRPDYDGIRRRARADAALAAENARRKACRTSNRYATGMNADVYSSILRTEILATVAAVTTAVEGERQAAFKLNWEMAAKGAAQVEAAQQGRMRLGADFLAGAGQNYGYLAESIRRTAKEDVGGLSIIGAALGPLLATLFDFGCSSESYCGGCDGTSGTKEPDQPGDNWWDDILGMFGLRSSTSSPEVATAMASRSGLSQEAPAAQEEEDGDRS